MSRSGIFFPSYRICRHVHLDFPPTYETGSLGRVERTSGTFQDRLVTELRLSGAATIDEVNDILRSFLSRLNQKFAEIRSAGRGIDSSPSSPEPVSVLGACPLLQTLPQVSVLDVKLVCGVM